MATDLPPIIAFDAESNGLAGPVFAAGAVLVDPDGAVAQSVMCVCRPS